MKKFRITPTNGGSFFIAAASISIPANQRIVIFHDEAGYELGVVNLDEVKAITEEKSYS